MSIPFGVWKLNIMPKITVQIKTILLFLESGWQVFRYVADMTEAHPWCIILELRDAEGK